MTVKNRRRAVVLESLEVRRLLAFTPTAIDIVPGGVGSDPRELTNVNGTLFFTALESGFGRELFVSDGTAGGTRMVKDINPGFVSSDPQDLVNLNGTLYFTASDGVNGRELWKSTGTAGGTVRIGNLGPGSSSVSPQSLTIVGNRIFFVGADPASAGAALNRLYVTDGTTAGTTLLADFGSKRPLELTELRGQLVFRLEVPGVSADLWKSNGTVSGTEKLHAVNPVNVANVEDTLFFAGDGAGLLTTFELWKSDGTKAGTDRVKNINTNVGGNSVPFGFTQYQGLIYFAAFDGANNHGYELWRTNGTTNGTVLFLDVNPGPSSSTPDDLTVVGNKLFFTARDQSGRRELFGSDGTAIGTELLRMDPGSAASPDPAELTDANGTLYLTAFSSSPNARRVMRTDGTPAGREVAVLGTNPTELTVVGDKLFFAASDSSVGRELFVLSLSPPPAPINFLPKIEDVTVNESIQEGSAVTLSGRIEDEDADDQLFLDVDWGDGSPLQTIAPGHAPFSLQHIYRDDDPSGTESDEYIVFFTWRDSQGAGNTESRIVTVHNVAPQVHLGGDAVVRQHQLFRRQFTFIDPGADSWTATVDYGDGSGAQELPLRRNQPLILKHSYHQPGTFQVSVQVVDDDGGIGNGTIQVTVLAQPGAGNLANFSAHRISFLTQPQPEQHNDDDLLAWE